MKDPCDCCPAPPTVDERVERLERRLADLEGKFSAMVEANDLWDGS